MDFTAKINSLNWMKALSDYRQAGNASIPAVVLRHYESRQLGQNREGIRARVRGIRNTAVSSQTSEHIETPGSTHSRKNLLRLTFVFEDATCPEASLRANRLEPGAMKASSNLVG